MYFSDCFNCIIMFYEIFHSKKESLIFDRIRFKLEISI